MIFEIECDTTNEGRTYGPDGAMFVPFIVLDFKFVGIIFVKIFLTGIF